MWFKEHPWVFPGIIGGIGVLYIIYNIAAAMTSKKRRVRLRCLVYKVHDRMSDFEVHDQENDARNCERDGYCTPFKKCSAFYQDQNTDRQTENTCDDAWYVFPDENGLSEVNEEVSCECQEHPIPQREKHLRREIIRDQAYSEKRYEFFIYCRREPHMCDVFVRLQYFWKALKHPRVLRVKPLHSDNFLHIVKDKDDR